MEKLLKIKAELDAKIRALLTSDGPLTKEQQDEHATLKASLADVKRRITDLRELDEQAARESADADAANARAEAERIARERTHRTSRLTDSDSAANGGVVRTDDKGRTTASLEETDEKVTIVFGESADAVKQRAYAELKQQSFRHLRSMGYTPRNEFRSFSEFIREGLSANGHPRFEERVNKHFASLIDNRGNFLSPHAAVQGMSEGVASDGGFFVMPEFGGQILDRVYGNNLLSRTDNYTVNGNNMTFLASAETSRAHGSRAGGMRGYFMPEGGSITATKPTTREVSLKLIKAGIVVYLTNELMADGGGALESYIVKKAAEEFNFLIGDSLVNGTGAGQPRGLMNWPSLISVAKESGQPASTVLNENVEKMYARFYMPNMGSAYWYHNQDILPQLNQMVIGIGTGGVPTFLPPGGAASAPHGMLKGRPLDPTEFNATLGTTGDLILADLKQMLSITKGGVAQATSMHIQFLTDQLAVRFIIRFNAGPWENAPITPFKGTNTQSSAIALDTRS